MGQRLTRTRRPDHWSPVGFGPDTPHPWALGTAAALQAPPPPKRNPGPVGLDPPGPHHLAHGGGGGGHWGVTPQPIPPGSDGGCLSPVTQGRGGGPAEGVGTCGVSSPGITCWGVGVVCDGAHTSRGQWRHGPQSFAQQLSIS